MTSSISDYDLSFYDYYSSSVLKRFNSSLLRISKFWVFYAAAFSVRGFGMSVSVSFIYLAIDDNLSD